MNPFSKAGARALASLCACAHFLFPSSAAGEEELPAVVVTATPLGSELFDLVMPANVLRGEQLRLKQAATLGETLMREPGVSASNFGPNASRPIIRGLDGDRIRILQNGAGVLDASSASFDHAVSVEPLLVEQIEIVRGPAALLYGGNAVGGVVNVVDGRIPRAPLAQAATGIFDFRYDSARREKSGGAILQAGNESLVFHVDAFKRDSEDLRIPGYARSSRRRALDPQPEEARNRLPNSSAESDGGALGASILFGDRGYTGLSYQRYDSDYGTVAEESVRIDLRQERWDFAGELRALSPWLEVLKYKFAHSDYEHREVEDGEVGTVFTNKGFDSRIELTHAPLGPLKGAFGLQWTDFDFAALGEEAFLPATDTRHVAAFVYEELQLGAAARRSTLSFGARAERSEVEAEAFAATGAAADRRDFNAYSGSVGLFVPLAKQYGVAFNAAYTERAPTNQELFADGPHLATDSFEVGNPNLDKEKSTAFDLSLRKQGDDWRGSVGVFYNRFRNYVALSPALDASGDPLFRNAEDRNAPATADPDAAGFGDDAIQQYNYEAVRARFRGFEAEFAMPVWQGAGQKIEAELRGDYTQAENRSSGEPLPRIPPLRVGGALAYSSEKIGARLEILRASAQNRVPAGESKSDGYTLLDASLSYRLRRSGIDWEFFAKGSNLLNEEIRLATSFLREVAPLAGRALNVGVRAAF